jgi:hypothetical protein
MNISPGEITSLAYTSQVRLNNAIEQELIGIANVRPCVAPLASATTLHLPDK